MRKAMHKAVLLVLGESLAAYCERDSELRFHGGQY